MNATSWPTPPAINPEQDAPLTRYEQLSEAEQARVSVLIFLTGCSLWMACAAVESTRVAPAPARPRLFNR